MFLSVPCGTFVCIQEEFTWKGPWLPHFLLLLTRQPLGRFSANLAHVCSSHGIFSEFGVLTFQPIKEVTLPKTCFYCVNTSYPMANCFTGQHDRSRQTPEKDVPYIIPAGPVTECAFARWRIVLPSCLDIMTS